MSSTELNELQNFSQALTGLVENTAAGVFAIKSAAYRVTSGILLEGELLAVANHALRRADQVPVFNAAGSRAEAKVLGREPAIDLAILKVDGLKTESLKPAELSAAKAGMLAIVVGMTADVGATASLGILGARGPARRNWRGGTLDEFLRLDVNLYPSQSGAAVVNAAGELLGMATPALSRHSTVVIPISTIHRIARELLEQGRIRHGYLGIGVQPVKLTGHSQQESGLMLMSVEPDSPAQEAGLLLGDILLALNGQPTIDVEDLHSNLRGDLIGKQVQATLLRGGKVITVELQIAERGQKK